MARPVIGMQPESGPFVGAPSGSLLNPGAKVPHMTVPDQTPEAPPATTHTDPATAPVVAAEGHFDLGGTQRGVNPRPVESRDRVGADYAYWAGRSGRGKRVGGRSSVAGNTPKGQAPA